MKANNMNIPKHTPGPWKIAGESNTVHEAFIIESESRTICWTADSLGEDDDEFTSDEDLANARLIASAPELLDSLKDLENILSCKPYDRDEQKLLVIARAAIAKAKGEIK